MTDKPIDDELTRTLRTAWFRYLDTVAPIRPDLHRFCLRLAGNIWDGEDLVQDTLLRGFGAMGRGDLHGEDSRVANPRAYLLRIASNLWIDRQRAPRLEAQGPEPSAQPDALIAREAGETLFAHASPQQRAAIVLKDVFDFSLEEIAVLLNTTPGAVKSALARGRAHLAGAAHNPPRYAPSKALIDRFVAAFNAKDAAALAGVLLETASIEVQGVGGGRGKSGAWIAGSLGHTDRVAAHLYEGEWVIANLAIAADGAKTLHGLTRLEEQDGGVSRIRSYSYTPETIAFMAHALGYGVHAGAYHQAPNILVNMIATTALPWAQ